MKDITSGIFEIASALIGVAILAILINRSGDTVKLVQTAGGTFNDLLKTVSLQNGMSGY